ncbi:DUF538 domain-containing protein [Salix suchowensis]|nr:DUF538 domain-containing protein [Salix suchowensis]
MNVTGSLSYGQIGALSGISSQELFLWFPVKGIRVDVPSSGLIYFDVGVVFKEFSLSLFEMPKDCVSSARDGGNCSSSASKVYRGCYLQQDITSLLLTCFRVWVAG